MVIVGGGGSWWPFRERTLARRLANAGTRYCSSKGKGELMMLDLFYVVIAVAFFALTWAFTKACDRL